MYLDKSSYLIAFLKKIDNISIHIRIYKVISNWIQLRFTVLEFGASPLFLGWRAGVLVQITVCLSGYKLKLFTYAT
jgi:hypothetical protein